MSLTRFIFILALIVAGAKLLCFVLADILLHVNIGV